jgi:hypothetical protein
MTKKQATARAISWRHALLDGRVVKFFDGAMLKAYPSSVEARAAAATAHGVVIVLTDAQRAENEAYIARYA